MTPIEMAALFHYRYIRIHPFEDGNGRISRLIVNYILAKHGYPMIVVKSDDKNNYLATLHQCDVTVGEIPAVGAHAELEQIKPLVDYLTKCAERSLSLSIKAAKGENIADVDDWRKHLKTKYANRVNKPAISNEIKDDVLDNEYKALLERIDSEFSELYSIFKSVQWKPDVAGYFDSDSMNYYSYINFAIERGMSDMRTSIYIALEFQQFCYKYDVYSIRLNNREYTIYSKELTYSDFLSDNDKKDVINCIGNYLNDFVETKGEYKK